jgi:hypothetical protein
MGLIIRRVTRFVQRSTTIGSRTASLLPYNPGEGQQSQDRQTKAHPLQSADGDIVR